MALSRTLEKRSKIYGDGGTADLFGKPELPDGFHYLPDVLSPAEENAFVRHNGNLIESVISICYNDISDFVPLLSRRWDWLAS